MNILEKEGINPSTLGLLMFIKLNTGNEYVRDIVKQYLYDFETESGRKPLEVLEELEYLKHIKGPKSRPWESVRLSEKGEKILKEMNQKPLHESTEYMWDYTKKEYERIGADKEYINGGGKLMNYISEFLYAKEKYDERMIRAVITSYVNQFDYDKTYLNKMSNLFFKSKNAFATKWNQDDCPLWQFIQNNQDAIKNTYKKI